ncbi:MAG: tRNA (adenosine(37)-N6)-threonylcarbamoyltransferase complex transferase subunit TsaD [Patescibacteria group bacterium]
MKILAIETSCDETAAAVVEKGVKILSNVVASSAAMHEKYGGIVPEVAARKQLESIIPVIKEALDQAQLNYQSIDSLAVTVGPGLIGSLLVGVETAKTIAFVTGKPLIPVNHVLAHMYANLVDSQPTTNNLQQVQFPAISLVVSGGHTELYLMESIKKLKWLGGTLDDAAGEAFDKTARLLGYGNRGGIAIQEAASKLKVKSAKLKVRLPRPMIDDESLSFSFSGLKTAILREWKKYPHPNQALVQAFAYEVQEAITDVLVTKTLRGTELYKAKSILLSGGVAANIRLREKFNLQLTTRLAGRQADNLPLLVPPAALCTDNAVYIGSYAYFRGKPVDWHEVNALPDLTVEITD